MDYDIRRWRPGIKEYSLLLTEKEKSPFRDARQKRVIIKKWKSREIYALITAVLRLRPNGMMTLLSHDKPMNNLWWWDFVIKDDKNIVSIMCGNSRLEAMVYSLDESYNLDDFLDYNMSRYKKYVTAAIENFEVHDGYINHYLSYTKVTEYLLGEIKKLNLEKPKPNNGVYTKEESEKYASEMQRFIADSIAFHALGKSLLLNSAFMAEAFLSLLIKIGYKGEYCDEKHDIKEFNKQNFEKRIKNLYLICDGFYIPIDTKVKTIQNMLKVMTLRNKYAHAELSARVNTLEPTFFDGDYPLIDSVNENYIIDAIVTAFHNPSFEDVMNAYEAANKFIRYITSLIPRRKINGYESVLELRIITRNRHNHKYSIIHHMESNMAIMGSG